MSLGEVKKNIEEFIKKGELDNATILVNKIKNEIGNDEEIASMEAIINIYNGEYNEALICIREGLKVNIFNSDLYFTMGNVYELKKEYNKAYLCYDQARSYTSSYENRKVISNAINNLKSQYKINVNNYSIVILTYNNLDYTKICIDSIKKYSDKNSCEIIIVDNNSTDGTVEWLKEQDGIKYILNDDNKGFPAGCNQGIEFANKENDILLLNNDTVVMPNSILNLRLGLYSTEKVGATGAVSNSVTYGQQIMEIYDDFDGYMDFALKNNISDGDSYEERLKLVGFAMFIRRTCLDKVGLLDEIFTPGNFEDDDISLRMIKAGYKLLLCKDSYIHHFGSVSFGRDKNGYSSILIENSRKFKEKWGFSSEYAMGIRNEIVDLIDEEKEKVLKILEVGCACGGTLLKIKNNYPNSNLYGIELNEKSVEISSCIAEVEAKNIENYELGYKEESFDYIIFADVLEHLVNPEAVLENMRRYLKPGGHIIISLPNIMHISVVNNLINGRFTYADAGILDRTHLKFFTLFEIEQMMKRNRYKVVSAFSTNVFTTVEENKLIDSLCKLSDENLRSQYLAYQYIVKIKKE